MDVLRAVTIQRTIKITSRKISPGDIPRNPFAATHMEPSAKGIAKREWLKRTKCPYSTIFEKKLILQNPIPEQFDWEHSDVAKF